MSNGAMYMTDEEIVGKVAGALETMRHYGQEPTHLTVSSDDLMRFVMAWAHYKGRCFPLGSLKVGSDGDIPPGIIYLSVGPYRGTAEYVEWDHLTYQDAHRLGTKTQGGQ